MSGGHWDYEDNRIPEMLCRIGADGNVIQRFPKLAQVFRDLGSVLGEIAHDLDWDLSSDSEIDDDAKFEKEALEKITKALRKKFKFWVYEVEP